MLASSAIESKMLKGTKNARILHTAGFVATCSAMHKSHSPFGPSIQHVQFSECMERPRVKGVTSLIVRQPLKILRTVEDAGIRSSRTPILILTYSTQVPHPAESKSGPMLIQQPCTINRQSATRQADEGGKYRIERRQSRTL